METKTFISSRTKTVLLLAASMAFVALAVLVPDADDSSHWRLLCGGFFGLCAAAFAVLLMRPQRLTFDREGYTLSGGLMLPSRVKTVPCRDIDEFFVYRTARGNKMIAVNFKRNAIERTWFARFSRAGFGADGAVPGLWPGGPQKMVDEFNRYRERALAGISTARHSSGG